MPAPSNGQSKRGAPRLSRRRNTIWRLARWVIFVLCLVPVAAHAHGPRPPCNGVVEPSYQPVGEPPRVQVWWPADLPAWTPPPCTGWAPGTADFLVAVSGRLSTDNGAEALLTRFGAISSLLEVRYWSVTEQKWKALIESAAALEGQDLRRRRGDFTAEELRVGTNLYFAQKDNRSSSEVIHRLRVTEFTPTRIVVEVENVTPVWLYVIRLYVPGDLQSVHFLDRQSATEWAYYSLSRARGGVSTLLPGYDAPYINRAVALFRHFAGLRTDASSPPGR